MRDTENDRRMRIEQQEIVYSEKDIIRTIAMADNYKKRRRISRTETDKRKQMHYIYI